LTIEVRGVGFDLGNASGRHFGLRGIRERAHLLGGTADIHSSPGQGTRITVELPIDSALGGGHGSQSSK
jgi:signal transduction histidine kinase